MRPDKERPGEGRAESANAGGRSDKNTATLYHKGKALLRDRRDGKANVYPLTHKDIETLRACGFDPVHIGHGLYVCWEPVPDEEKGVSNA